MPYADPEKQAEYQREWNRKQRSKVQPEKKIMNLNPATAKELLAILTSALNHIVEAKADPIVKGRAIAYLCNVGFKGVEISDLEERLLKLEEELLDKKH